ncbi:MAG: FAD-dependent oxidoreductase [Microbacterium sp.]|uniref:FAD-dependent oxidoreductase n=1 Tax=Microbacterium sp. TaxID=51671 RepID=UPI0032423BE3
MVETDSVDIVVMGSGLAGTSAALHASRRGARVLLLEKSPTLGGSAALSAGMFWTAPTLEAYERRVPLGRADLGKAIVDDYDECVQELRDLVVRVADEPMTDIMTFGIGYSTDIHGILARCWDEIRERGSEIRVTTPVREVLRDAAGVTGVVFESADGTRHQVGATSVISATGGFQGDPALRASHFGPNADRLVFRSNPGSVGDGLRMGRAVGAGGSTGMATFYGHLLPYPMDRFEPEDFLPASQYYSSETVLVNLAGERFVDETLGDEILNQVILHQPHARGVLIFDEHIHRTAACSEPFPGLGANDRMQTAIDTGARYCTADSIDELIDKVGAWGIDPGNLRETLSAYVAAVANGGGPVRGVMVAPSARAPQDGPFHALMVQPSITFTFGGLPITTDAEVLDTDARTIPGFFAAGADIGGLSNEGYAGGLAPAYITGRWAGRAAAARAVSDPVDSTIHADGGTRR